MTSYDWADLLDSLDDTFGRTISQLECIAICQLTHSLIQNAVGSGGCAVERWTVNRGHSGSIPPTAISKLRQFCSPHIYLCLSEETLKVSGPFYLVSTSGEVKDPTQGVDV